MTDPPELLNHVQCRDNRQGDMKHTDRKPVFCDINSSAKYQAKRIFSVFICYRGDIRSRCSLWILRETKVLLGSQRLCSSPRVRVSHSFTFRMSGRHAPRFWAGQTSGNSRPHSQSDPDVFTAANLSSLFSAHTSRAFSVTSQHSLYFW